jgi:putative DNA modification/repair radical SAM protein
MYSISMDLATKLTILASAAKYDASCASSGSARAGQGNLGANVPAGVCHSWTSDGRCVSLLKVLYSNYCRFDCAYCPNRVSADIRRTSFSTDELVRLTTEFYKRNYVEGLFLSSGVFADPDIVMSRLVETARKLRMDAGFSGYIHLKAIPGSGERLIAEAGRWADRLSANIELPTERSLANLAPQKSGAAILGAMNYIAEVGAEYEENRNRLRSTPLFAPAGQSTQLIVGASPEDDRQILALSDALYRKFRLRRVYYSAYVPIGRGGRDRSKDPRLPDVVAPPLVREHRLYQADWLLRFYKFGSDEILDAGKPNLDADLDPKTAWALNHLDRFPVEAATADFEQLLRVPGIGRLSAQRILEVRRTRRPDFQLLKTLGVTLKRARYFLTASGSFLDRPEDPARLRRLLSDDAERQLPLFEF